MPGRVITSSFCSTCGSPVPYLSKSGEALVVPAGSLNAAPNLSPEGNIFWQERAPWFEDGINSEKYNGFSE